MNQIKPTDEQMAAARKFISDWCRDGAYVSTHDVAKLLATREAPLREQVAELTAEIRERPRYETIGAQIARLKAEFDLDVIVTLAEATAKEQP